MKEALSGEDELSWSTPTITGREPKQREKGTNMGRGDTKSRRGKIFKGSYGKWRPKSKNKKKRPKKQEGARG